MKRAALLMLLLLGCTAPPPPPTECVEKIVYRDVVVLMPCTIEAPAKGTK
jgi:hypothetical protein